MLVVMAQRSGLIIWKSIKNNSPSTNNFKINKIIIYVDIYNRISFEYSF